VNLEFKVRFTEKINKIKYYEPCEPSEPRISKEVYKEEICTEWPYV